jgi:hypothetical protein
MTRPLLSHNVHSNKMECTWHCSASTQRYGSQCQLITKLLRKLEHIRKPKISYEPIPEVPIWRRHLHHGNALMLTMSACLDAAFDRLPKSFTNLHSI